MIIPILNYTTKIDADQSVAEIQKMLAKHGAKRIMSEYNDDGDVEVLCFEIVTPYGVRGVKLPARVNQVHAVLQKQKVKADEKQARRVAWRIVKDWVEAQMAILESEQVSMDEIFLPYMVDNSGVTLYESYVGKQIMLEE